MSWVDDEPPGMAANDLVVARRERNEVVAFPTSALAEKRSGRSSLTGRVCLERLVDVAGRRLFFREASLSSVSPQDDPATGAFRSQSRLASGRSVPRSHATWLLRQPEVGESLSAVP